jgi:hypothetical protein
VSVEGKTESDAAAAFLKRWLGAGMCHVGVGGIPSPLRRDRTDHPPSSASTCTGRDASGTHLSPCGRGRPRTWAGEGAFRAAGNVFATDQRRLMFTRGRCLFFSQRPWCGRLGACAVSHLRFRAWRSSGVVECAPNRLLNEAGQSRHPKPGNPGTQAPTKPGNPGGQSRHPRSRAIQGSRAIQAPTERTGTGQSRHPPNRRAIQTPTEPGNPEPGNPDTHLVGVRRR